MNARAYYEYYTFNGANFFTLILKPDGTGKYPVVVTRSPYVGRDQTAEALVSQFKDKKMQWAEHNYVLVFQHCRGRGLSSGEFVPYIYEREDSRALREWVRKQNFYNGQMFLLGASYTATLQYCTAPFEEDILGAVFRVQDSERYRLWYRNGMMRTSHADWYFGLYKDESPLKKAYTMDAFSELPIKNLSERYLGERAEEFEQMLAAPRFADAFWQTRLGGAETRDALSKANIPLLLTTGYNDFYMGGMFRMWDELAPETKEKSAMIVSPYNHGDCYDAENGMRLPNAAIAEQFGKDFPIKWFDAILKKEKPFVKTGSITYYRTFENAWRTGFASGKTREITVRLPGGEKTLIYNPGNAPAFGSEGTFMNAPGEREDVISVYTAPSERDLFIKGRIKAKLTVSSDCDDTSFYVMIGIHTENGDYALRQDITSLLYQKEHYVKNEKTVLDFVFDEYAFALKKGQYLRIDIAPSDKNRYVCHRNQTGDYSLLETYQIAENKVFLDESFLILPIEE